MSYVTALFSHLIRRLHNTVDMPQLCFLSQATFLESHRDNIMCDCTTACKYAFDMQVDLIPIPVSDASGDARDHLESSA